MNPHEKKDTPCPYVPFPAFVLRTPFYPLAFFDCCRRVDAPTPDELIAIYRRPEVREALLLASPNLFDKLEKFLRGELDDKKEIEKLHYAIMRYLIRMASRPTPFGLFAGCTLGHWGDATALELAGQDEYRRHTRLDMNYLCALAQDLAKHPQVKGALRYFPNSSLYRIGKHLRYVEFRYQDTRRTHHIVAVEDSPYIQRVLERAASGARMAELAELLVEEEITLADATAFVEELIASQVLVHDLEPAITGPEFLHHILSVLAPLEGVGDVCAALERTRAKLEWIDGSPIGATVDAYQEIAADLKPLGTAYELKFLFQTDMIKPARTCTLDRALVAAVTAGLTVLNKFASAGATTNLTRFRDAFIERYETREMPLLTVLDSETGIGYLQTGERGDVSPLVDQLRLPGAPGAARDMRWDKTQSLLLRHYLETIKAGRAVFSLKDEDVKDLPVNWGDLPDTLAVTLRVLREDGVDKLCLQGAGGSSAANLLGRFCHGDPDLHEHVRAITAWEAGVKPDAILAEIIHLPEARLGNILLRPVLRPYEIPYLARSAVAPGFQIKADDLVVAVRGNRVLLRSRRLNKEIVPRLSSAHNFSNNALPVYQFLADLQTQNLRGGLSFHWGTLADEHAFLPRVEYGDMILSLAQWRIKAEEIKDMVKLDNDAALLAAMGALRTARGLPRHIALDDGDNELYIDSENPFMLRTLFAAVKNRPSFQVVEFLFAAAESPVYNRSGRFVNEFFLQFHNPKPETETPSHDSAPRE
jgi:lantibiotic biosynthesis protein